MIWNFSGIPTTWFSTLWGGRPKKKELVDPPPGLCQRLLICYTLRKSVHFYRPCSPTLCWKLLLSYTLLFSSSNGISPKNCCSDYYLDTMALKIWYFCGIVAVYKDNKNAFFSPYLQLCPENVESPTSDSIPFCFVWGPSQQNQAPPEKG